MILMNKTVDINVQDYSGINAFWIAALFGHGHIMRILAVNGANVLVSNHRGMNAFHIACT